jgi:hypothetical protein
LEVNRDITKRRHMEHVEQAVHREIAERLTFLQQVLDTLPSISIKLRAIRVASPSHPAKVGQY